MFINQHLTNQWKLNQTWTYPMKRHTKPHALWTSVSHHGTMFMSLMSCGSWSILCVAPKYRINFPIFRDKSTDYWHKPCFIVLINTWSRSGKIQKQAQLVMFSIKRVESSSGTSVLSIVLIAILMSLYVRVFDYLLNVFPNRIELNGPNYSFQLTSLNLMKTSEYRV